MSPSRERSAPKLPGPRHTSESYSPPEGRQRAGGPPPGWEGGFTEDWPSDRLREKLANLPASPGVYLMQDAQGRVIYVGKSSCLKNRVRSYFHSRQLPERTRLMVSLVRNFQIATVASDMEALLLENNLIKKYHPYFNVLFRDDKSYLTLELTTYEDYPRLRVTHQAQRARGLTWGPFTASATLRRTKDRVQKLFRLRPCAESMERERARPCLYYHIKMCSAPCVRAVTKEEYALQVDLAKKFLNGQTRQLVQELQGRLKEAASQLNYEYCAQLRDTLRDLELVTSQQQIVFNHELDEDYIALVYDPDSTLACALVWPVRGGNLQSPQSFILESRLERERAKDLASFIQQYYAQNLHPPPALYVEELPTDLPLLEEWLLKLRGGKVKLRVPQQGERRELLAKAIANGERSLREELETPSPSQTRQAALLELGQALKLPHTPWRLECYDISNIQGKYAVGSMVVFEHGLPHRSHYRKFKIEGMDTPNDFAMMAQVLRRRLAYLQEERPADSEPLKRDPSLTVKPDLIIVDGGLGQLGVAVQALAEAHLTQEISLAGLAKREEELFRPGWDHSVLLERNSPAFNLVTHLRNEAHRFAITFHRQLRSKGMLYSKLSDIPGLGPKTLQNLYRHFPKPQDLAQASPADLERVPGIGPKMAAKIAAFWKRGKGAEGE